MNDIIEVGKRYMNRINHRGYWFKPRARSRRVVIEATRYEDGSYYIHGAKAKYREGGKTRCVTINCRELKKELLKNPIKTQ